MRFNEIDSNVGTIPALSTRTLEEINKEIEILKRYNATIPEALNAERAFLEEKKHIQDNLPKIIKEQLGNLFEGIQENIEIHLSYSKIGGLVVSRKSSQRDSNNVVTTVH